MSLELSRWLRRPWFSILAVVVAAFGFLAGQVAGRRAGYQTQHRTVAGPADATEVSDLALQLERHNADLRVSWNRRAGSIRQAKSGLFSIWDGESAPQSFTMDADGLRTGSVVYSPSSSTVQFRLQVFGPEGESVTAWILALIAQPSSASNRTPLAVLVSPAGGAPVAYSIAPGRF
jgi:hypothetical protein